VGLATGLLMAVAGARLLPRDRALGREITPHQKSLYALGIAFACYGVAVADPRGNAFIAVFVCAVALGISRPDIRECFENRSEELIEIVKLGIFVVFGSLLTFSGLLRDGLAAVAIVAVTLAAIRPLSIFVSLAGTGLSARAKAFIGWFGPKGVATMTFSLVILHRDLPAGERIFAIAALTVLISIIVHGVTDHRDPSGSAGMLKPSSRARPRSNTTQASRSNVRRVSSSGDAGNV